MFCCHVALLLKLAAARLHGLLSTQRGCPPWPRPCVGHAVSLFPEGLGAEDPPSVPLGAESSSPIVSLSRQPGHPLFSRCLVGLSSSFFPHWASSCPQQASVPPLWRRTWPQVLPRGQRCTRGSGRALLESPELGSAFLASPSDFLIVAQRAPRKLPSGSSWNRGNEAFEVTFCSPP